MATDPQNDPVKAEAWRQLLVAQRPQLEQLSEQLSEATDAISKLAATYASAQAAVQKMFDDLVAILNKGR